MLAVVVGAIALMTLKSHNVLVHEVVHFSVIAFGLASLCVAMNSNGETRVSFSVLGTFTIGIIALEAAPISLGRWFVLLLDPQFPKGDPFGPVTMLNPCFLDWFALLAGVVANTFVLPIVRWSNPNG